MGAPRGSARLAGHQLVDSGHGSRCSHEAARVARDQPRGAGRARGRADGERGGAGPGGPRRRGSRCSERSATARSGRCCGSACWRGICVGKPRSGQVIRGEETRSTRSFAPTSTRRSRSGSTRSRAPTGRRRRSGARTRATVQLRDQDDRGGDRQEGDDQDGRRQPAQAHVHKLADFHAWLDKVEPQLTSYQFAYLAAGIMVNSRARPRGPQGGAAADLRGAGRQGSRDADDQEAGVAVIVPRDKQMTELTEFSSLKTSDSGAGPGKTFDGREWAHVRGVGDVTSGRRSTRRSPRRTSSAATPTRRSSRRRRTAAARS